MDPNLTQDDEEAQMDAGFNSENAGPSETAEPPAQSAAAAPAPADQPAAEASAATDPSSSTGDAEPAVDPYAGLPQEVRALLAKVPQLEAEVASANERSRRAEGRVHSLQGQLAKLATPAPAPAPTEAPAQPLSKLQHAKETLGHDMPEVIDALDELAALLPPPQSAPPKPAAPVAAPVQSASPEPAAPGIDPVAQAHFEALDATRPDWFQTLDSDDCKLWLTTRPDIAQVYRGMKTAGDALTVLKAFDVWRQQKQTAETTQVTRATRMAAAVVPTGNTRAPARAQPMSEEEAMEQGFRS